MIVQEQGGGEPAARVITLLRVQHTDTTENINQKPLHIQLHAIFVT